MRKYTWIIILLTLLTLIYSIITTTMSKRESKTIDQLEAFNSVTNFVKNNTSKIVTEKYSWVTHLSTWDDANDTQRFTALPPALLYGKSFDGKLEITGLKDLYENRSQIMPEKQYWLFHWNSPGVIDYNISFYVDATEGQVKWVSEYSSPD